MTGNTYFLRIIFVDFCNTIRFARVTSGTSLTRPEKLCKAPPLEGAAMAITWGTVPESLVRRQRELGRVIHTEYKGFRESARKMAWLNCGLAAPKPLTPGIEKTKSYLQRCLEHSAPLGRRSFAWKLVGLSFFFSSVNLDIETAGAKHNHLLYLILLLLLSFIARCFHVHQFI